MVFSNILFVVEYFLYRIPWKVFDTDNLWFIVAGQPLSTFLERVVFQITKSHKRWQDFCTPPSIKHAYQITFQSFKFYLWSHKTHKYASIQEFFEFSGCSHYIRPTDDSFSGVARCITKIVSMFRTRSFIAANVFNAVYYWEFRYNSINLT